MENFKEFHEILKENLDSSNEEYDKFIDNGPDIFKLLINILNEKKIEPEIRLKISAAIAYFVAPHDVLPEIVYGPWGYVDDIFISIYVLKDIEDELGFGYLESLWEGDQDLKKVIDECYENSKEILGDKVNDIIAYVGLNYKF